MEVKIHIPASLEEIPLNKYQRFAKLEIEDTDVMSRKMIQIFCGVDEVLEIKHKQVNEIYTILTAAMAEKPELTPVFKHRNREFGFIPSLDEMTYGELIDLETYMKDWSTMNKAMSVLYRPVTKRNGEFYSIEKYRGTVFSDTLSDIPMNIVAGAVLFFYRIAKELFNHYSKDFHRAMNPASGLPHANNSQNSGDSSQRSIRLLAAMSRSTIPSLNSRGAVLLPFCYSGMTNTKSKKAN